MTKCLGRLLVMCIGMLMLAGSFLASVYADAPLQSSHYQVVESTLGNGGLVQSQSTNFQSAEAIGATSVGNTSSSNYQIETGPKTTPDPALSFGVTSANASFGNFSSTTTATATATFSVSDYTSFGYAVQIIGDTPHNAGHYISPMGTDALGGPQSPQTGIDQFGINMVANTAPKAFGANPDQGQFGAGVAAANYNTPNKYRYVSGETIATAPKSSGVTVFTISYIINVDHLDPGGAYTSSQDVVCTGTF